MYDIKTNKEILKIKSRIFFGFTNFQAAMLICGFVVGTLLFVVLPFHMLIRVFIMVLAVGLFVTAGMIEINNMPLMKFLIISIRNRKINNKWWIYENNRKELKILDSRTKRAFKNQAGKKVKDTETDTN